MFISADFGLLKFRYFVDLSIEEDVSIPEVRFVVTTALYLGGQLSHFSEKVHILKTIVILVCGQNIIHRYLYFFQEDYYE